ncbi:PQQ-binding-like beta-propeller repeat protein [Streptomyces sp. NPDC051320]|uniref:outer membrane protein assembly factor BamB family protein n=1 Tax=Streptomyces sp. NPDC051320 TaxID=3154644 RepID=UPI0034212023
MTQPPPQPPEGPPQGGFSKQPPAGGYGGPPPPNQPPPNQPPAPPQMPPQAPPVPPAAPQQPPSPPGGQGYGQPQPQQPQPQPQPPTVQDPAYGYPQTPPAQPGYGYPQNQPQQPYGYPTQPMQPQQAGDGGGRNGGFTFGIDAKIITAAAVAIVLIIGAGFAYSSSKGDDKTDVSSAGPTGGPTTGDTGGAKGGGGKEKAPANVNSRVLFQLPYPKVGDVTGVNGSWVTDTLYVKSGVNKVVGYDAVKGSQSWTTPLPGPLCAATDHISKDNKTVIAFQPKVPTKAKQYWGCSEVAALDLNTGKLLWTKSAKDGDEKVSFDEVTLGGGTVAAGGTGGGAAWDLETGTQRWAPKASADQCEDRGYAGGDNLVAVRSCGDYDSPQVSVQVLNPTSGAPTATFQMPSGVQYAHVVSTKPLVVAADVGDTAGDGSGISDYFSIDEKTGKQRARISADADTYAGKCGSTDVEDCHNLVVGNDRLYVPTEKHDGAGGDVGQTNEIVAFDLATGKLVNGKASAGKGYTAYPVRMDGSNVIAYKTGPYDKGGQVTGIDGSTFQQTLLMNNPADEAVRRAESGFLPESSEIRYVGGRLYLADDLISEPYGDSDDKKYLAIGFGTS